jgi:hypothetical protein
MVKMKGRTKGMSRSTYLFQIHAFHSWHTTHTAHTAHTSHTAHASHGIHIIFHFDRLAILLLLVDPLAEIGLDEGSPDFLLC